MAAVIKAVVDVRLREKRVCAEREEINEKHIGCVLFSVCLYGEGGLYII